MLINNPFNNKLSLRVYFLATSLILLNTVSICEKHSYHQTVQQKDTEDMLYSINNKD